MNLFLFFFNTEKMNLFTYWLLFYKSREEKQTDKQERERKRGREKRVKGKEEGRRRERRYSERQRGKGYSRSIYSFMET